MSEETTKTPTSAEAKETTTEPAKPLDIAAFDPLASAEERQAAQANIAHVSNFKMPEANALDKLLAAAHAAQAAEEAAFEEAKRKREAESAFKINDEDDPFKDMI